jgi:hypothetical protein
MVSFRPSKYSSWSTHRGSVRHGLNADSEDASEDCCESQINAQGKSIAAICESVALDVPFSGSVCFRVLRLLEIDPARCPTALIDSDAKCHPWSLRRKIGSSVRLLRSFDSLL